MNIVRATVIFLLLVGCVNSERDSRLDGTWTSNKKLTLENLGAHSLKKDQLEFLKKNLGEMQYIHKKGKVAVNFISMPIEPLQYSDYSVYEVGSDYVVVGHKGDEKIKMQFYKNCIFHITEWGINEYFCKSEQSI